MSENDYLAARAARETIDMVEAVEKGALGPLQRSLIHFHANGAVKRSYKLPGGHDVAGKQSRDLIEQFRSANLKATRSPIKEERIGTVSQMRNMKRTSGYSQKKLDGEINYKRKINSSYDNWLD